MNKFTQINLQQRTLRSLIKNSRRNFASNPAEAISALNQKATSSDPQLQQITIQDDILQILNSERPEQFRNIAIIAHVDHGKTTLVDTLLKQSGCHQEAKSMDSNQLEQEKGITILSKCTGITYKGYKVNIVDTPGHQDFGGEVERIMDMVDGVVLVVCATEGPMAQTKYVLQKALKQNLKPIVVINKIDRPTARLQEVENEIFDLFCALETKDEFLDYPIFYASARDGWALNEKKGEKKDLTCLLDAVLEHVPHPVVETSGEFKMLVSQTESNLYFGKMLIGRIQSGSVKVGEKLTIYDQSGDLIETNKVFKIIRRYGMNQIEMQKAVAGDIVSIAGFENATVSHCLNEVGKKTLIPCLPIDPPTISIEITVNTSPLAGKEGDKISAEKIRDRLIKEAQNDVALKIDFGDPKKGKTGSNIFKLEGRGDLHLGLLVEKLRREGFEMAVTPPAVVYKKEGKKVFEPVEYVEIEVPIDYIPSVLEKINFRRGDYVNSVEITPEIQRLIFHVPTRGLLGLRGELLHETRGIAQLKSHFMEFQEYKGPMKKSQKGAILASTDGQCTIYGIKEMETKGTIFVRPGQRVYNGMVIGEHVKDGDIDLNPTKEKKLTNVRSVGHEEQIKLAAPRVFSIEEAISYVRDDEIIEVTPQNVRIRKRELDPSIRKKHRRDAKSEKEQFS